jgi:sRNA-binding carbon storage regulator CsrA
MALVLTLRKGEGFIVGARDRVKLVSIQGPHQFQVQLNDGSAVTIAGTDWITLREGLEIMPGKVLSHGSNSVRVAINAPTEEVTRPGYSAQPQSS